jgi:hypothetical protein
MSERQRLPNRREHTVRTFQHDGRRFVAGLGYFDSGDLGEVFLDVDGQAGSDVAQQAQTVAILVSMLLQVGVKPDAIRHSITGPVATLLAQIADSDIIAARREQ